MTVKSLGVVLKNVEKTVAVQDDRIQGITNTRMKRVLLNNPNYTINYPDLVKFLDTKIDFGKYKAGAVQDFIPIEKFDDFDIKSIKLLKNFDWSCKIEDFYDFSWKMAKIKDAHKWSTSAKIKAMEGIKDIIKHNVGHACSDIFLIRSEGYTWEQVLEMDSAYIGKICDLYDFSDPEKNKQIFTYYTNKGNIEAYMAGELDEKDVTEWFKNHLESFEIAVGWIINFENFKKKFKKTWFTFIDTETTRLDQVVWSMLSFWWVKVEYNEFTDSFEKTSSWEIFVQDLKEPVSDFSAHWGTFGKYAWNKITEKVLKEKWLHPIDAAEQISLIMKDGVLFAHNASFDNLVLNTFFNDIKVEVPKVKEFYDTYSDAFPMFFQAIPEYRDMVRLSLDNIAEKVLWVSVKTDAERHTALKDALWSADILIKLLSDKHIKKESLGRTTGGNSEAEVLKLF